MDYAVTFFTAMVPVLELRAAIPLGISLGLPPPTAFLLAVAGNLVPVPFIILLIRRIFLWMKGMPWWKGKIERLERKAHGKGDLVRKYRTLGLCLLVAVPLPGTGAWTGALVAAMLDIRLRNALPAIVLGVLIAGCLVLAAACGVVAAWQK